MYFLKTPVIILSMINYLTVYNHSKTVKLLGFPESVC